MGSLTLTPAFDPATISYTATTTNATNKVTYATKDPDTVVTIKLGGVEQESPTITWEEGDNVLTLVCVNGGTSKTYTVTVTKPAEDPGDGDE